MLTKPFHSRSPNAARTVAKRYTYPDVTSRLGTRCARTRRANCLLETEILRSAKTMRGVTIPQDHQTVRERSRAWRRSVPAERSGKANRQPRIVHARAASATWPERVFVHSFRAIGFLTPRPDELLPDPPTAASVPIRRSCWRLPRRPHYRPLRAAR